jgi:hypothetical protein
MALSQPVLPTVQAVLTRPLITPPTQQSSQRPEPTSTLAAAPPSLTPLSTSTSNPPTMTPIPTATLYPVPDSVLVNGLPPESFVYLPPEVVERSQRILAQGMAVGRDSLRFSKIGDSIVDTEQFFVPFDTGNYQLGGYQYLQEAVRQYGGSFGRFGFALRDGLNSTSVMDPMWADKEHCLANETSLACEIRLNNPSLLLIHFGTNDWSGTFDRNMRQIIDYAIGEGIVPVLVTKANRVDGSNERNDILRVLAAEYQIPVWDFDVVASTLPDRGLDLDEAHLTISTEFDYALPGPIYRGYKAFNLTGLIFMDSFMRNVVLPVKRDSYLHAHLAGNGQVGL